MQLEFWCKGPHFHHSCRVELHTIYTPFWKYCNTFQAPATIDALVFTHYTCLFFLNLCTLPFSLLLLKMMFLQQSGKTDPDCMKVIHMYYSSLPLPFILTVGWNCMKKTNVHTGWAAACLTYVVFPCFVFIPMLVERVVILMMITLHISQDKYIIFLSIKTRTLQS